MSGPGSSRLQPILAILLLIIVAYGYASSPSSRSQSNEEGAQPSSTREASATARAPAATRTPRNTATPRATATPTPEPAVLQIAVGGANLRAGPGTNFDVLTVLPYQETVTVIASTDDQAWYNVRTAEGQTGWLGSTVVAFVTMGAVNAIAPVQTVPAQPTARPAPVVMPTNPPAVNSGSNGGSGGSGGSGSSGSGAIGCCKVCRTGYACGNSCISRSKACHVGPGCACNGSLEGPDVAKAFRDVVIGFVVEDAMCVEEAELGFVD